MKKILIYMDINENEYAIYEKTNYRQLNDVIQTERKGNCPNYGNKVWLQALVSELTTSEVQYKFWNPEMSYEYINSEFDCIIKPSANIFSTLFVESLDKLADVFSNFKIPIYIIACGIQLDRYEEMDDVIKAIKKPATKFIDAVYSSGGEFALRGNITKEFFDKLGFSSAVVTGCPSIFQMGRDLKIEKKNVKKVDFKAVINGQNYLMSTPFYMNIFDKYKGSIFIDQDHYYDYLYNPDFFNSGSFTVKDMIRRVKDKGYLGLELVSSNRLLLFADVPNWMMYLMNENYAFSFGARIHGNIMSILSGIPAMVHCCDCRTLEMAEYFDIPHIEDAQLVQKKDLYEIYEELDYSKFNNTFKDKFDFFQKFFVEHGLIDSKLNEENIFLPMENNHNGKVPDVVNEEELRKMNKALIKNKYLYKFENRFMAEYRKIKK